MDKVLELLKEMNINYEIITHPPVYTVKEANKYIKKRKGIFVKNLFLTDKQNFYLIIIEESKKLNFKILKEITHKHLSFASPKNLETKLKLKPGSVSLFGLINNQEKDVKVFIDKDITKEKIVSFHPNDNTATLFIKVEDMFKFLNNLNFKYEIIDL